MSTNGRIASVESKTWKLMITRKLSHGAIFSRIHTNPEYVRLANGWSFGFGSFPDRSLAEWLIRLVKRNVTAILPMHRPCGKSISSDRTLRQDTVTQWDNWLLSLCGCTFCEMPYSETPDRSKTDPSDSVGKVSASASVD